MSVAHAPSIGQRQRQQDGRTEMGFEMDVDIGTGIGTGLLSIRRLIGTADGRNLPYRPDKVLLKFRPAVGANGRPKPLRENVLPGGDARA
ncbi:hypothetical protein ASF60_05975 [Methylobacterium sp. Leaf113]|nr:hypothetical protein ASF60_05975 [Methylobacterium sp. Leaf113]